AGSLRETVVPQRLVHYSCLMCATHLTLKASLISKHKSKRDGPSGNVHRPGTAAMSCGLGCTPLFARLGDWNIIHASSTEDGALFQRDRSPMANYSFRLF
ncbi:unnamed protein product, partial [Ectocarpus sp. 12 AP-2014]